MSSNPFSSLFTSITDSGTALLQEQENPIFF